MTKTESKEWKVENGREENRMAVSWWTEQKRKKDRKAFGIVGTSLRDHPHDQSLIPARIPFYCFVIKKKSEKEEGCGTNWIWRPHMATLCSMHPL